MDERERTAPDLEQGAYELNREDADGGVSSQPVYLFTPNKKRLAAELGGWYVCWQEATMILAKMKCLNLTDLRVLLVLQAKLDFDNWIRMSYSDIGNEIDVARQNVALSVKKLIKLNVLVVGPSTRNVSTYRLNPELVWKGTMRNAVQERRIAPKLTLLDGGKVEQTAV